MEDPPDATPPITWLTPEDFDALVQRLDQPASSDPRIARVLAAQPPWDGCCDKTATPEDG